MYVLQLSVQAARCTVLSYNLAAGSFDKAENGKTVHTLMCLSIGTPKNNKFSICSKWKIHYF